MSHRGCTARGWVLARTSAHGAPGKPRPPTPGRPSFAARGPRSPHQADCVMTSWTGLVIAPQCPGMSGQHQAAC